MKFDSFIAKPKKHYIIFCFFFFNIPIQVFQTYAQANDDPFSSVTAGVNLISVTNSNLIHHFWDPQKGYEFSIESPFYSGDINAGAVFIPYKGKHTEYPDFTEYLIYAGWGSRISLPLKFEISGSIKFGYFIMSYSGDTLSEYQKSESEFSAGAGLGVSYPVIKNLFISAGYDLTILFTSEKLKFYYFSAGLAYKFDSPAWLRNFFN